ncbi:MAG: hypothetical protein LBB39_02230 [Mycoplasmataceae bacterium]|nr:hypothetical protein [Mycoplasmataceae bacterium]
MNLYLEEKFAEFEQLIENGATANEFLHFFYKVDRSIIRYRVQVIYNRDLTDREWTAPLGGDEVITARMTMTPSEIIKHNDMYRRFFLQKKEDASDLLAEADTIKLTTLLTFNLESVFDKVKRNETLNIKEAQLLDSYRNSQLESSSHDLFEEELRATPSINANINQLMTAKPELLGKMMKELAYSTYYPKNNQTFVDGLTMSQEYPFPMLCKLAIAERGDTVDNFQNGQPITLTPELMLSEFAKQGTNESKRIIGLELGKLASKIVLETPMNQKQLIFGLLPEQQLTQEQQYFLDGLQSGKREVLHNFYENGILQTKMVKEHLVSDELQQTNDSLSESERVKKLAMERYNVKSDLYRRNADILVLQKAPYICEKHKNDWFLKKWRIKQEIKKVYETEMEKQLKEQNTYQYEYTKALRELSGKTAIEAAPIMEQSRQMVAQYSVNTLSASFEAQMQQ